MGDHQVYVVYYRSIIVVPRTLLMGLLLFLRLKLIWGKLIAMSKRLPPYTLE